MKQETNNEMDLLLRRLGRRDEAVVPEDHLDADELSAYAENALPAAARARYTGHLAECSRCRSLVAQLSSSAGVVAATESVVPEPSGFRKFLATLFTPMVLRYAAPALGLIVVAAIGFVVLRRNQAEPYVAQNTAPNTQQQQVASPVPSSEGLVDSYRTPAPGQINEEKKEKNQPAQPPPPPNMAPAVTSVEADVAKDKAVAQPKPEEQAASAGNEPPPVKTAPSATPEQSPRAAETEAAKNEVKIQSADTSQKEKAIRFEEDRKKDSTDLARARKRADAVSAPATGSARSIQSSGADFSSNTRNVAGRRFQKKGGVWIDTDYDSSKDAVTLTRGSEQYRALVADEPAIKTIADQLEGEIIVVWKGHTYRIR